MQSNGGLDMHESACEGESLPTCITWLSSHKSLAHKGVKENAEVEIQNTLLDEVSRLIMVCSITVSAGCALPLF